jgi:hypothetical protein
MREFLCTMTGPKQGVDPSSEPDLLIDCTSSQPRLVLAPTAHGGGRPAAMRMDDPIAVDSCANFAAC